MKNVVCPRCGSSEIIGEAEVRDYDASSYRPLSVSVRLANPASGLIRKTHESSPLQARVCGECGYTELYAMQHKELLKAHTGQ